VRGSGNPICPYHEHPDYATELNVGCVCAEKIEDDYVRPRLREKALRSAAGRKVADEEAGFLLLDRPGRREAARWHRLAVCMRKGVAIPQQLTEKVAAVGSGLNLAH
jgi:hypothetical protein